MGYIQSMGSQESDATYRLNCHHSPSPPPLPRLGLWQLSLSTPSAGLGTEYHPSGLRQEELVRGLAGRGQQSFLSRAADAGLPDCDPQPRLIWIVFWAVPCGLWDLSSPTSSQTQTRGSGSTES